MARGRTLTEFQASFPDEARCAAFLFKQRPRRASCALIAAAGARPPIPHMGLPGTTA